MRVGEQVIVDDIAAMRTRWPAFATGAAAAGFASVYAFPMRLREATVGGLNLFSRTLNALEAEDRVIAQALADIATIGILQQRSLAPQHPARREPAARAEHPRRDRAGQGGARRARQASRWRSTFGLLRSYARTNRMKLSDVAHGVVYPPHLAAAVLAQGIRPDAD